MITVAWWPISVLCCLVTGIASEDDPLVTITVDPSSYNEGEKGFVRCQFRPTTDNKEVNFTIYNATQPVACNKNGMYTHVNTSIIFIDLNL